MPLVAAGQEESFWEDLFAHFDRRAGSALFLHLPQMPTEGPVFAALGMVLSRERRADPQWGSAFKRLQARRAGPLSGSELCESLRLPCDAQAGIDRRVNPPHGRVP